MMTKKELDPQTDRCLKELKDIVKDIESGKLVLRRYNDELIEQDGLHRKISIHTTFVGVS